MGSKTGKKPRVDPVFKLARTILPAEQCDPRSLVIRDVANHTIAEQRDSISLGQTKTVRKKTRVETLRDAGVINAEQAASCEWYGNNYEMGYEVAQGTTANYTGTGGGGFGAKDLFARHEAQRQARLNIEYARRAIPPDLLGLLEYVVAGPVWSMPLLNTRDKGRFAEAAKALHEQVGHMAQLAA